MPTVKMLNGTRIAFIAIALLFSPASVHSAEYYTWVDENGVTNYSQRKPPDLETTHVTPTYTFGTSRARPEPEPEVTTPDSSAITSGGEEIDPDALVAEEREKYEAELAEERKVNCDLGKQNLARLQTYARIRVRGDDGSMRYLTDSEMQQKKKESREAIKIHCRG